MLFTVRCLYHNGLALEIEELLTPSYYTGHLVIENRACHDGLTSFNRRARFLNMTLKEGSRDVVPSLDNPCLGNGSEMKVSQMTLFEYERRVEHKIEVAHIQYWILLPLVPLLLI
jgi:hypothetical protein